MHRDKYNKRILMIGWGWPPKIEGGLDTHVFNISSYLQKDYIDLSVSLPKSNMPPIGSNDIRLQPIGIEKHFDDDSIESLIGYVERYNKNIVLSKLNPDLVHAHDWLGVLAAIELKEQQGIPFVLTIHSLDHHRSCRPFDSEGKISSIEHEGIVNADTIITVSEHMREEIIEHHGADRSRIRVIPNGPSYFVGKSTRDIVPKDDEKTNIILCCGRLSSQKGIEHLILAARDVIRKHPETRFILVGKGHLQDSLESMVSDMGMKDSFNFMGFISVQELRDLYSSADAYVMPSVSEPFGISALDALVFGIPTVLTSSCGLSESLEDGKDAIIIGPRSSRDISRAIIGILDDPELSGRLSINGKEASERFKWDRISDMTVKEYMRLL